VTRGRDIIVTLAMLFVGRVRARGVECPAAARRSLPTLVTVDTSFDEVVAGGARILSASTSCSGAIRRARPGLRALRDRIEPQRAYLAGINVRRRVLAYALLERSRRSAGSR
jgi:hypothetical protein